MDSPLPAENDQVVSEEKFRDAISTRAGPLLHVAGELVATGEGGFDAVMRLLTRPFLGVMLAQSSQLEELLDAYGALNNARWHTFRSAVATIKAFAALQYNLLHLYLAVPGYRLLAIDGDFLADTRHASGFTARTLQRAAGRLVAEGARLGLASTLTTVCKEELPAGRLPHDRALRRVASARETIARLATAFLNLAESAGRLHACTIRTTPPPWARSPSFPGEAEIRALEQRFHNLQALYDTHLSNTDVEQADPELRSLRGHTSAAYHLLELATGLAHHYERHLNSCAGGDTEPSADGHTPAVAAGTDELVQTLCGYALSYTCRFVQRGRILAQDLLRRYAEIGECTVSVPRYRGFHVRPSTLVAKIVNHYGSPVTMTIDGESYDAAMPLELFRANEKINAQKRRWLAGEIARIAGQAETRLNDDLQRAARRIIISLAEQARIIIYEQPVPAVSPPPNDGTPELPWLIDEITRLQSLGKIDIETELPARFRGDKRVLADIALLAENGYGEDAHGNNIALPKDLAYLRGDTIGA